jgi:hypothetical protein
MATFLRSRLPLFAFSSQSNGWPIVNASRSFVRMRQINAAFESIWAFVAISVNFSPAVAS